jgi:hypothetical protein
MAFSRATASQHAVSIITSALTNSCIKLVGAGGVANQADAGKRDAEYLLALFTHLRDGMADEQRNTR